MGLFMFDEEAHAERLWEQLRDAVTSHLVSDVPLGAFLSGGIDSSAVVAAMALENGQPVKTFFPQTRLSVLAASKLYALNCFSFSRNTSPYVTPSSLKATASKAWARCYFHR